MAVIDKDGSGAWSVLCGIHADQKLSMSAVAKHLGTARSRLRLMTDDEVVAVVGMTRGAIGLVAPRDGVRGVLDVSFRAEENLYFGVGRHDMTIRVRCSTLIASGLVELADLEADPGRNIDRERFDPSAS
jgi:prolyl-tRNA editing enzyme YbaK/EbsC (Cys-tRNA(Pro) deacylase)